MITKIQDMDLAKLLKIVSKGMVYNNLSTQSQMWDFVLSKKVDPAEGRYLEFNVRTSMGPAAVGFMGVNGGKFKSGQKAEMALAQANAKKFSATIEVENSVVEAATRDFARYGEPIAEEIELKGIALARQLSMAFQRDGTGVIGSISSVSASGGNVVIVLKTGDTDRGFVGWFDIGDKIVSYTTAGVTHMKVTIAGPSDVAIDYLKVIDKDRSANTITCEAYNSSGVKQSATAFPGDGVQANDLLYRNNVTDITAGEGVIPFDTTALSSTSDYNDLTIEFAGLEALTSSSAIKVHALQYGTAIKGSRKSAGAPIDSSHFQAVMSLISNNVGANRYNYKDCWMNTESYDALLDARETDRRFQSVDDSDRGSKGLGFQYGDKRLVFRTDEFVRGKRIWILPEGDVLQYHGSDFAPVKPKGGSEFHLKTGTGTHYDTQQMYMDGLGLLACVHPAACGVIHNFTV